jgi:phage FluMu protein Com
VRCPSCGKKLAEELHGTVRIICPRCKKPVRMTL